MNLRSTFVIRRRVRTSTSQQAGQTSVALPCQGQHEMGAWGVRYLAAIGDDVSYAGMTTSDDMPCCPSEESVPDCQKSCPLALLCVANCFANPSIFSASANTQPLLAGVLMPHSDPDYRSIAASPPRKPPRI